MERTYTVQDLLAALKRRRRLALAVAGIALLSSAAVIALLPKEYRASSVTQIEPHRLPPDLLPVTGATSFDDRMRTLRHGLLARPVLERVIRETEFFGDANEDMEKAVERMRRQVEIRLEGEVAGGAPALLFVVDVRGQDPQKVAKAAELLPRYYAEMTASVLSGQARSLRDTLEKQVKEMGAQLSTHEQKLLAFKAEHATEVPEAAEANLRAVARLAALMQMRLESVNDARRRRTEVMARIPELESDTGRATTAREDALRRLEAARSAYGSDHPDVKKLERAYADVSLRAEDQESRFKRDRTEVTLGRIDQEIARQQQDYERTSKELDGYQKRLEASPRWGEAMRGLSRDYEVLRAKYTTTLARAIDASAAEQLLQADATGLFRTVQPATVPQQPFAPDRLRLLLIAIAASIALGLIATAAAESLDSSLRGPEDAMQLGAPVLASIPRIGRRTA